MLSTIFRFSRSLRLMSDIYRAFLEHQTAIRRVIARYCAHPEDIDDLAQHTFLRGFAAETKATIREPRAFLLRIARNLALSEVKRHGRRFTDSLEDCEASKTLKDDQQASAEDQLDTARKLAVLSMAIAQLPPECRNVLLMRKVEQLRFKQIATRLNVSVSTAEKRIAKALVLCAAALRREGYDPAEFGAQLMHNTSSAAPAGKPRLSMAPDRDVRNLIDGDFNE